MEQGYIDGQVVPAAPDGDQRGGDHATGDRPPGVRFSISVRAPAGETEERPNPQGERDEPECSDPRSRYLEKGRSPRRTGRDHESKTEELTDGDPAHPVGWRGRVLCGGQEEIIDVRAHEGDRGNPDQCGTHEVTVAPAAQSATSEKPV